MGKSVNEYYAEKMKKLLEMQNSEKTPAVFAPENSSPKEKLQRAANKDYKAERAPQRPRSSTVRTAPKSTSGQRSGDGRDYYDRFRSGGEGPKKYTRPNVNADNAPGKRPEHSFSLGKNPTDKNHRQKKEPEQTAEDRLREEEKREEAEFRAARARRLRKIRDNLISVVLIAAVAVVLCVVVYRLVFVISDINVEGTERYSKEEILAAAEISEGDHLYSFRNSQAEKLITVRCPAVGSVTVDKVAPSTVNLYVTEEPALYYADFYGEYRELSGSLRVLYAIEREKAEEDGLVQLKLPTVSTAYSGKKADYSGVRSDSYIYDVTAAAKESELWEKIEGIDLRNKYDIVLNCENKYLVILGDYSSLKTKLKITSEVLCDPMFAGDVKAKIDVSDLSATSVITDSNLDMSRFS